MTYFKYSLDKNKSKTPYCVRASHIKPHTVEIASAPCNSLPPPTGSNCILHTVTSRQYYYLSYLFDF